jgi:hypothetical protein
MIGFIDTSLQLQLIYNSSHIELLNDVRLANLSLISDWSLLYYFDLSPPLLLEFTNLRRF